MFKGAMLGCATGDAVGELLECMSAVVTDGEHSCLADLVPSSEGGMRLTSHSLMAISLAQAIAELGRFHLEQAGLKFARLLEGSDGGLRKVRFTDEASERAFAT